MLMNGVYAMNFSMKVSNVQVVHFYVVQSVLVIFILLIKIIVLFVDIKNLMYYIHVKVSSIQIR